MRSYSNEQWLQALRQPGERQKEALEELRDYLLRAVLVYLRIQRSDLAGLSAAELQQFAEDMTQEALFDIQDKLDTFRGESKFTTWAYRFVINRAASELRRSRYSDLSLDYLLESEETPFAWLLRDEGDLDPELAAERADLLLRLANIMRATLTERQYRAVLAVHLRGLPIEEVAAQMDTNRNSLYKLLYDARQKIKAQLEAEHLTQGDILALFESYS